MGCSITVTAKEVLDLVRGATVKYGPITTETVDARLRRPLEDLLDPAAGSTFGDHWTDGIRFTWAEDTGVCVVVFPDCAEAPYAGDNHILNLVYCCATVRGSHDLGPNMIVITKKPESTRETTEYEIRQVLRNRKARAAHA